MEDWEKWKKWQNYWWRIMILEDRGHGGWRLFGDEPTSQVPNSSLAIQSLEKCVAILLEDAAAEFADLDGEVRVDCFTVPDPAPDAVPVYSAQMRIYDHW
ncbi:hypothetical protein [Crossiella cryophila]|uniref:Uncharacterized protein n=1 Tax=Crossiella cryophila TaxID=43355 RepID=A0A7W7FVE3_9PSEU|nr:hypothetical protein [Crossiella cryophila]MBB4679207.1 hypothetical protein [Crossiella cryophila]